VNLPKIIVSVRGLRYGIVMRTAQNLFNRSL
jgi:hypothetical protein